MPETKQFDPFKPAQPSIPGVPASASAPTTKSAGPKSPPAAYPEPQAPPKSIPAAVWVVVGLMIVLGLGGGLMYWTSASTPKSQPDEPVAAARTAPAAETTKTTEHLPLAPGIIGTTRELKKPWSSKRFLFRGPFSADPVPALVVHLPNGQYWGISMIEPFGTCELEYVTDPRVLQAQYGFRANHPMVGDPCTHAVYDLLQYDGGAPNGGLVRGAIVHGVGVRPPLAIEIEVEGKKIRAVRME
ncbi:MAG: hypothetical protein ACRD4R_01425 [Candidatus Acidiferrales bacterium]